MPSVSAHAARSISEKNKKNNKKNQTFFKVNSPSTQHNLVLLQHRYSASVRGASPLPQGFLCPLTSAPFGHDHQRRHAEQRRLAPGDPTAAPPGRRRHPAGHRPDSVYHATDRWDREKPGDIIAGIFHPPIIHSFLLLLRGWRHRAFLKGHQLTVHGSSPSMSPALLLWPLQNVGIIVWPH